MPRKKGSRFGRRLRIPGTFRGRRPKDYDRISALESDRLEQIRDSVHAEAPELESSVELGSERFPQSLAAFDVALDEESQTTRFAVDFDLKEVETQKLPESGLTLGEDIAVINTDAKVQLSDEIIESPKVDMTSVEQTELSAFNAELTLEEPEFSRVESTIRGEIETEMPRAELSLGEPEIGYPRSSLGDFDVDISIGRSSLPDEAELELDYGRSGMELSEIDTTTVEDFSSITANDLPIIEPNTGTLGRIPEQSLEDVVQLSQISDIMTTELDINGPSIPRINMEEIEALIESPETNNVFQMTMVEELDTSYTAL